MHRMSAATSLVRSLTAMVLALLLAVRLLSPAGFMPSFDHGAVTIVACPDAGPAASPMAHHHRGDSGKFHQQCPYAAAAGAAAPVDLIVIAAAALLSAALPVPGLAFPFLERRRSGERPPARAPPLPA